MKRKQPLRFMSLSIDDGFNEWIKKHKCKHRVCLGSVHSIYDKVINIQGESNKLYSILHEDIDNGPYSIRVLTNNTTSYLSLGIKRYDPLFLIANDLVISKNHVISLEDATVWNPKKIALNSDECLLIFKENLNIYHDLLQVNIAKGCAKYYYQKNHLRAVSSPSASLIDIELEKRINCFLRNLNFNYERIQESILALIGFGMGLTPSGDDFITGFITALNVISETKAIKTFRKLKNLLKGQNLFTTDVSVSMIRASIEGRVRERLVEFINLLCMTRDKENLIYSINKVFSIGSSSGIDLSIGIVMGIKYGFGILNNED